MKNIIICILLMMASLMNVNAQRVVLIEQFTNSGCPICASFNPAVNNYVANNPSQVVSISYHTSFPYSDSMYFENPVESNARVAFYNVVGVPYSIVDGNYYRNPSSVFGPVISATVVPRLNVAPAYQITQLSNTINLNTNKLEFSFVFESLNANNVNDSLQAMIVVIENTVLKSSYAASPGANTETEYKYVMRKMIPDASGSELLNRNVGGQDLLTFDWNLQNIKDLNELDIVVFVQNISTREIYQAALFSPAILTSIPNETEQTDGLFVFPVPAQNSINISMNIFLEEGTLSLISSLGQVVWSQPVSETNIPDEIDVRKFSRGIYSLLFVSESGYRFSKVILN